MADFFRLVLVLVFLVTLLCIVYFSTFQGTFISDMCVAESDQDTQAAVCTSRENYGASRSRCAACDYSTLRFDSKFNVESSQCDIKTYSREALFSAVQNRSEPIWISLLGDSMTRRPIHMFANFLYGENKFEDGGDDIGVCCSNPTHCDSFKISRYVRTPLNCVRQFIGQFINQTSPAPSFCISWEAADFPNEDLIDGLIRNSLPGGFHSQDIVLPHATLVVFNSGLHTLYQKWSRMAFMVSMNAVANTIQKLLCNLNAHPQQNGIVQARTTFVHQNMAATFENELPDHKKHLTNLVIDQFNRDTFEILSQVRSTNPSQSSTPVLFVDANSLTRYASLDRVGDGVHFKEAYSFAVWQLYLNIVFDGMTSHVCALPSSDTVFTHEGWNTVSFSDVLHKYQNISVAE